MPLAAYRYRIFVENAVQVSGKSLNVWNVGSDAVISDANIALILGDLKTFYTALATYVCGTFSIGSRILEFAAAGGPPRIVAVAAVAQTNAVATPLPGQLALCLSWRTALAGKRYRGRTFLGPLNVAVNASGAVVAGAITAVNNAAAVLVPAVKPRTTGAWGLVVHSAAVPTDTPITLGTIDTRMDTVRSRN